MSNPTRLHVPALAITLRTTPEPEVKQEVLKYLRSQGLAKTPELADKITSLALDRAEVAETAPIRAELKRLIANAGTGLLDAIQRAPEHGVVKAEKPLELSAGELKFWANLPEDFQSTADVQAPERFIGQNRLRETLRLGLSMDGPGYNVLISGLGGKTAVDALAAEVLEVAKNKPVPDDQVFVPSFAKSLEPKTIRVPAGKGRELSTQIEELAGFIEKDLPGQLEKAGGAKTAKAEIAAKRAMALENFQKAAKDLGLIVKKSGENLGVMPAAANGEPMTAEQVTAMSDADKAEFGAKAEQLKPAMASYVAELQKLSAQEKDAGKQLQGPAAKTILEPKLAAITESVGGSAEVKAYLDAVLADVIERLPSSSGAGQRYAVNVTVDNSELTHAPVVVADDVTAEGLFGAMRVNPMAKSFGVSDIEVGDLSKANGGYLVIDLRRFQESTELVNFMKSLITGEVNMTRTAKAPRSPLRPQPFGLDVKVIAVASHSVAQAVKGGSTDVFQASTSFDSTLPNDDRSAMAYAGRIGEICRAQGLPHFDKSAVAVVLEHSAREAGTTNELAALPVNLEDIVREAAHVAGHGAEIVTGDNVATVLEDRRHRANLGQEGMLARMIDGSKLIDVTGAKVGQINGLAVMKGGGHTFGLPARITASVGVGQNGVINVERQSEEAKSGFSHNKGIEILQGYLRERFGSDKPLALTASIAFEQSYGGIDGDSASSTELYAMLSKLSGVPIRQGTAVTGSVNQWGEVQPIGGVNHKVEGFFDVCKARGLTGDQGVMVPISNMKDLVLRPDVVEAIEQGQFHIYPVKTIDQGIGILTGVAAGDVETPGTINYLADQRLRALAGSLEKKDQAAE